MTAKVSGQGVTQAGLPGEDFDAAAADPSAFYPAPEAIMSDPELSHAQKLRLLQEWGHDITDHQTATNEGMAPPDAETRTTEAGLAQRINALLDQLGAAPEGDDSPGRTVWKRLGS